MAQVLEEHTAFKSTKTITTATTNARVINITNTFDSSGDGPGGVASQPTMTPSINITNAYGVVSIPLMSPGAGVTITNAIATLSRVQTGNTLGVITNRYGHLILGATLGTLVPTNNYGISLTNHGASGITLAIGIDIQAQNAATTNIGLRIAKADTYSFQLSDTGGTAAGGITFGIDTTLYRSAADTLKTDDSFIATGSITGSNISGTNTGDQLIFQTIAVSGQSNIVADTTSDTLTIAAGVGISLTTDASTDTLTITTKEKALFDHFADVGNTHTDGTTFDDLYSDTIPASTLNTNGDKITARYSGIFVSSASATREIKVLFAGTTILDTGALTTATAEGWDISVMLIRVSSSVVRCVATVIATTSVGAAAFNDTTYTEVTSLTLTSTNILKITGVSGGVGAAASDIVAKLGSLQFLTAA